MGSHRVLLAAGSNARGQLGICSCNDTYRFTPCQFAGYERGQLPDLTSRVDHIACGANHTVLLLEHLDGSTTLWGTGDGRRGQLGPEYPREGADPAPWTVFHKLVRPLSASHAARGYAYRRIAAAWETTYVVLSCPGSSDVLLSMGSDDFGALGAGEGTDRDRDRSTPSGLRVIDFDHIFPDASGWDTQPRTISVRSLHAGPRHVVVQLVMEGSSSCSQTALVGWGASRPGQLGQHGEARSVVRPTPLPVDIHEDPIVSCALGNQHTVILHESGCISALGSNKQGQIPSVKSQNRVCRLGCTWNGTYMQTTNGDKHVLLSTGSNAQGQLGRGHTGEPTSAVDMVVNLPVDRTISNFVCGSEHVLVLMTSSSQKSNSVLGWGWNEHGNMGVGSSGNITVPTQLWPREDIEAYNKYPQRVVGVWAGCATSWLVVE